MERVHRITGGGGVGLSVVEAGDPGAPPLVLIHGVAQSRLSWRRQFTGQLARRYRLIAFDLRGHGASDRPAGPAPYRDGRAWAADLSAIIAALGLRRPVLVGWSYGGMVIGDYLRHQGDGVIGGLVFVGAAVKAGTDAAAPLLGPALPGHARGLLSEDIAVCIAATRAFLRDCAALPLGADDHETLLGAAMLAPPHVRRAVLTRREDYDDALAAVRVPTLVVQGADDAVVLPAMARHIVTTVPGATGTLYEGVGHMPFIEAAGMFDADLDAFMKRAVG